MTKQEKIQKLHALYGWKIKDLEKHNDNQIEMLFTACKDEDGNLTKIKQ